MKDDTKTQEIFSALAKAIELLSKTGVAKDSYNELQRYKFRSIDDIYNAVAPVLATCGLVIVPQYSERTTTEKPTKTGGMAVHAIIKGTYSIYAKDGSFVTITTFGEALDTSDKATNKAMSAAYKYLLIQLFCLPTEGDGEERLDKNKDKDADYCHIEPINKKPKAGPAVSKDSSGLIRGKLVETIRKTLSEITKGFSEKDKAEYLKQNCGVDQFKELLEKTDDELYAIGKNLVAKTAGDKNETA